MRYVTALILAATCSAVMAADIGSPIPLDKRVEILERDKIDKDRRLAEVEKRLGIPTTIAETGPVVVGPTGTTVPLKPVQSPPTLVPRAAQGHTHTCANGHTWDYTMDGGSHVCPFCGLAQFVVDQSAKPLTQGPVSGSVTQSFRSVQTFGSGGGCANGQCPTAGGAGVGFSAGVGLRFQPFGGRFRR